jgi:hypothetical protein
MNFEPMYDGALVTCSDLFGSLVDAGRVWPMGAGSRLLCILIHAWMEGSK